MRLWVKPQMPKGYGGFPYVGFYLAFSLQLSKRWLLRDEMFHSRTCYVSGSWQYSVELKKHLTSWSSTSSLHYAQKRSQKNSQYSLVWTILKANRKTPFNVIQMKSNDVLDFASNAKVFSLKSVSAFTISFIAHYKVNHG